MLGFQRGLSNLERDGERGKEYVDEAERSHVRNKTQLFLSCYYLMGTCQIWLPNLKKKGEILIQKENSTCIGCCVWKLPSSISFINAEKFFIAT